MLRLSGSPIPAVGRGARGWGDKQPTPQPPLPFQGDTLSPLPPLPFQGEGELNIPFSPWWGKGLGDGG